MIYLLISRKEDKHITSQLVLVIVFMYTMYVKNQLLLFSYTPDKYLIFIIVFICFKCEKLNLITVGMFRSCFSVIISKFPVDPPIYLAPFIYLLLRFSNK